MTQEQKTGTDKSDPSEKDKGEPKQGSVELDLDGAVKKPETKRTPSKTEILKKDKDVPKQIETKKEPEEAEEKSEAHKKHHKIIGRCFEILKEKKEGTITMETGEGLMAHYYIEVLEDKSIDLEMVDENGEPTGVLIEQVSAADFSRRFKTCSRHRCPLLPKTVDEIAVKMADNRTKMGEKHLENGELDKAEEKFNRALNFDEKSVRASLGMGKVKLDQNKTEEAMVIFNKLSGDHAIYEQANKHTLNEFGIYLRKQGLFDLAIDSYEKAITVDAKDEALYFNLGRAYGDKGTTAKNKDEGLESIQKAIKILREAQGIKPNFPEAKKHMEKLIRTEKTLIDSLLGESGGKGTQGKEKEKTKEEQVSTEKKKEEKKVPEGKDKIRSP